MGIEIPQLEYTLPAAVDHSANQYKFMSVDASAEAVLTGAGDSSEGVLQNTPVAGAAARLGRNGITQMFAGGVIAIGDDIASDATGRAVIAVAGDEILGTALGPAGALGVIFTMLQLDRSDAGNGALSRILADPGNGGALSVVGNGQTPIVSVGAETRTLADATFAGQLRLLYLKTDGGNVVITAASPIDQTGRTVITFDDVGEYILLVAIEDGADIEWRVAGEDNGNGDIEDGIADPGDGNAIPVTQNGHVVLVSAGAETRTLAIPTFLGQRLFLFMDTDAGDIVLTVASAFNQNGDNTLTFQNIGEACLLYGSSRGGTLFWSIQGNDAVGVTTV